MSTLPLADITKAIQQRNVTALSAIMFDHKTWNLKPGYLIETELWDYKLLPPAPKSGSTEEWANLAKDVVAFHNHKGGIIIFGVANNFKVIGHRTELDSKLVNDALRKYIGDKVWLDYQLVT